MSVETTRGRDDPRPEGIIYFAHGLCDYASQRAADTLRAIERHWPNWHVRDPERLPALSYASDAAVEGVNAVCALEHGGHICHSVFVVVTIALRREIPIYVQRDRAWVRVYGVCLVDANDGRVRYARLIVSESVCGAASEETAP